MAFPTSFSSWYHRDFRTVPALGGSLIYFPKFEDYVPIFDGLERV